MKKFRPGISFADYLVSESSRGKVRGSSEIQLGVRLYRWLGVVVVLAMSLLIVRLLSLQLISGSRLRVLADENRIRQIKLGAPRGKIFDRNGRLLADNRRVIKVQADTGLTLDGWSRLYPEGLAAAHVVGYLSEINPDEVGLLGQGNNKYNLGDVIGRSGIEQQYEASLRGVDGGRLVEVDSGGKVVREMGRRSAKPGQDLHLTLDTSLQQVAWQALNNRKGAVVASNPKTGEVLVLTSSPDEEFNRAIGGVYAPGSTFKVVTVIAALAEDKLKPKYTFVDTGQITVGKFVFTNWFFTQYGRTEGETGWVKGLTRSVDTFFYKVGEYTGPELLAKWANNLGLGVISGIDLSGEVAGLIPTPKWKEETKEEQWFLGNTYQMAIGQSDLLVTPLQVNIMAGVIAARGEKCRPHLVNNPSRQGDLCTKVEISPEILDIVKRGMVGACSSGGTAFPFFDWNGQTSNDSTSPSATNSGPSGSPSQYPIVACKTGTAEYVSSDGKIGTHAWLTAYAPADDPTIAITALVEGGGEGSRAAAPIVRKVLAKYFGVEDHYNYAAVAGEGE